MTNDFVTKHPRVISDPRFTVQHYRLCTQVTSFGAHHKLSTYTALLPTGVPSSLCLCTLRAFGRYHPCREQRGVCVSRGRKEGHSKLFSASRDRLKNLTNDFVSKHRQVLIIVLLLFLDLEISHQVNKVR